MGYYSEVTLTMYKNDLAELVRSAKDKQSYAYDLIRYAKVIVGGSPDGDVVTLHWESVKWYNSNAISFIESFLNNDIQYVFKRIGEENGDVEEEQNDDDWYLSEYTSITRYIEIDGEEQEDGFIDTLYSQRQNDIPDEDVAEVKENEFLDVLDAS